MNTNNTLTQSLTWRQEHNCRHHATYAANENAKANGRTTWNDDDRQAYTNTYDSMKAARLALNALVKK